MGPEARWVQTTEQKSRGFANLSIWLAVRAENSRVASPKGPSGRRSDHLVCLRAGHGRIRIPTSVSLFFLFSFSSFFFVRGLQSDGRLHLVPWIDTTSLLLRHHLGTSLVDLCCRLGVNSQPYGEGVDHPALMRVVAFIDDANTLRVGIPAVPPREMCRLAMAGIGQP